MARQFTRGRGRLGSRRETSWLAIDPASVTLASSGSAAITHTMTTAEKAKLPFTVIRTRLNVHIISDQLGADEFSMVGFGMCVVTEQAVSVGITAVPTPMTELRSDMWFVHQVMYNDFTFVSGVGFDSAGGRDYEIDSKAARKVNEDQEIIAVAENSSLTAAGCTLLIGGRLLIKEH